MYKNFNKHKYKLAHVCVYILQCLDLRVRFYALQLTLNYLNFFNYFNSFNIKFYLIILNNYLKCI